MKLQIVLLSLVAVVAAEQNVYCGRRLAMALAMMCDNEGVEEKRGSSAWAWLQRTRMNSGAVGPWLEQQVSPNSVEYAPWLPPHRARSISRGKRQIVMECCMKPCSENELLSYC
ncbi:bombyxin A-1 homolog [Zerene cesonia]|uniref:bombyxin A-1 homolog n=1 Tax=Zerene cesonia TaxID=33412 RepID=UPI0018E51275|nr:bombyxin A-1 homolog [Zerene cesonia]